jgi:sec-independent protein translocase protein TatA
MNLGVTELLVILGLVLLIFGGTRVPKLARSLGQSRNEFEKVRRKARRQIAVGISRPRALA